MEAISTNPRGENSARSHKIDDYSNFHRTGTGFLLEMVQCNEGRCHVGGRNKLAKLLGVSAPYLGGVLRGEKPMAEELAEKVAQIHRCGRM
jgi:hypothetical protein